MGGPESPLPSGTCLAPRDAVTVRPALASRLTMASDPIDPLEVPVLARLHDLGIPFERHAHPPVATVEAAVQHWAGIEAMHFKNLFLRNQKGDRHYLVVVEHAKPVDLKRLAEQIGDGKLSFASPERLQKHLGLTPGSVTPFGLMNDPQHAVRVFLDAALQDADRVSFHPNINTATLVLSAADLRRFLAATGHVVRYVAF